MPPRRPPQHGGVGDTNQLPGLPSGREDEYPWVQAMQAARRRLPRVKLAIAAAGAFALGVLASLAAGQTGSIAAAARSTPAATTDIFGQSTQEGVTPAAPDSQPPSFDGGPGFGGGAPATGVPPEQAPRIVTAQS